ncbi:unnamed protein product [Arabis nemorensis]|uniref:Uncharacterized protein n=1 Tax=Arabis nemorensis TaxID=586526 RepID=A0A565AU27_9BRAS|nr:unnamed protein product [Arabis nemorensis]
MQDKKDKKRKKGINESPTKKQPKQLKRVMHYSISSQPQATQAPQIQASQATQIQGRQASQPQATQASQDF